MDRLKLATQILEQAENSLRSLVATAAGAGDYQTVMQIVPFWPVQSAR